MKIENEPKKENKMICDICGKKFPLWLSTFKDGLHHCPDCDKKIKVYTFSADIKNIKLKNKPQKETQK